MTNEERHIAVLDRMLESMDVYDSIQPTTERKKAIKAAIQALSQEPTEKPMTVDEMEREYEKSKALFHKIVECDDAISRNAALEKMADYVASGYADSAEDFEEYSRIICQLPPVTPQKHGKWIRVTDKTGHLVWECDKCSWQQRLNTNFCPDCGSYNGGNDNGNE